MNPKGKKLWQLALALALGFWGLAGAAHADQGTDSAPVSADEQPIAVANNGNDLAQIIGDMQRQMQAMQSTINSQNLEIQMLKKQAATEGEGRPVQAPPAAPAFDLNTFQDMLGSSTDWIKGLKQAGDMRLRMENFYFFDQNADKGANDRDRNRFRIRLRYGFEKDLGDDFAAGFRLVTGSATDPNSTNVTLGNPGYFNYKPVFFDKAYAIWKPHQVKDLGLIKLVEIGGGKFSNPFLEFATTNVWDSDVTPEGAYESAKLKLYDTPENKVGLKINLGQFILNENAANNADAELLAYQAGLNWATDMFAEQFDLEKPINIVGALSFYQYLNYNATVAAPAGAASLVRTNILAGSQDSPAVLDFYHQINTDLFGATLRFFANYTHNTRNTVSSGAGQGDDAYGIGFRYGKNNKPGDWEINYAYYYLEANATAAAFNDSDFGGPGYNGFTNRKGHKFGLTYRLTKSLEGNLTGYVVTPVNDVNAATFSTSEYVLRTQSDLVWKF